MLESFVSLLTLATMVLAAFGLGRPMVRALGVAIEDGLSIAVWSLAMGAIAMGLGLAVLGLVGAPYAPLVGVASLAAAFWGAGELVRERWGTNRPTAKPEPLPLAWAEDPAADPTAAPQWLVRLILTLAGLACFGSLVGALAPPTASEALGWHLDLPKRFLNAQGLVFLPHNDHVAAPLLVEMWYLWGLVLGGPVVAQLVHWAMGVLLGLATVVLARPILGRDWARLAGALVVLTPGVNYQMTVPLCDLGLAAMTTLALAAWWRGVVGREERAWFVLAGLAGGAALGAHRFAFVFALAMGLVWAWNALHRADQRRRLLGGATIAMAVALGTGGLWYARAAWHHAHANDPLLAKENNSTNSGWHDSERSEGRGSSDNHALRSSGRATPCRIHSDAVIESPDGGLQGLLTAPWQVTMRPERFGGQAHQLGALYLGLLPGLAVTRRLRGLGVLLAVAGVYALVWRRFDPNVRLLFPILSCLAVAAVWVAVEMRRMPVFPRRLALGTVLGILIASGVAAVARTHDCWAVAVGLERREDYLARREPSYTVASVVNLMAEPGQRLLVQDDRMFYFDVPVTSEIAFRRARGYDQAVHQPGDYSRALREAGFTHVLVFENLDGRASAPTPARLADADPTVKQIAAFTVHALETGPRRYRFLRLGPAEE